ncbi:MAG: L-threonylcarbamoyladenylate synthase [Candidatus Portnoybacteria bacterium]|nr:L-threonylcarbamoyladenylate synthase [Candidatus Portnoybacteria bacterium]
MTKILKISTKKPEANKIKQAANIIKNGGLVAFPTETVYGLGGNIFDKKALKKIYITKGRPYDNPLIVHIANLKDLSVLAKQIPKSALKLAKNFWPGPLTIILKKKNEISKIATAGLNTIAIRMPDNKIALELIIASDVPIAAPSANMFTKPSPTLAKHVLEDFKNKIPLIIDGGQTQIGLESTVIDLTSKIPTILRPGKITIEDLKKILGKVEIYSHKTKKVKSPGTKYKHYSPKTRVVLVYGKITQKLISKYNGRVATIKANENIESLAKNLFKKFREFDHKKIDTILVENVKEKGLGVALMNRIKKAASNTVKS